MLPTAQVSTVGARDAKYPVLKIVKFIFMTTGDDEVAGELENLLPDVLVGAPNTGYTAAFVKANGIQQCDVLRSSHREHALQ